MPCSHSGLLSVKTIASSCCRGSFLPPSAVCNTRRWLFTVVHQNSCGAKHACLNAQEDVSKRRNWGTQNQSQFVCDWSNAAVPSRIIQERTGHHSALRTYERTTSEQYEAVSSLLAARHTVSGPTYIIQYRQSKDNQIQQPATTSITIQGCTGYAPSTSSSLLHNWIPSPWRTLIWTVSLLTFSFQDQLTPVTYLLYCLLHDCCYIAIIILTRLTGIDYKRTADSVFLRCKRTVFARQHLSKVVYTYLFRTRPVRVQTRTTLAVYQTLSCLMWESSCVKLVWIWLQLNWETHTVWE